MTNNLSTYRGSSDTSTLNPAIGLSFTNEASGSSTIEATTRFIDSKAVVEDTNDSNYTQISNLDDNIQDILKFLERPTLIFDGTISTTGQLIPIFPTTPRTPLLDLALPLNILTKGRKLDKIANFEYLKCTSVIKIMVNANPMVCGRFWVCFAPVQGYTRPGSRIVDKSLAGVTSYPGVELDLQLNNSVTLEVPWCDIRDCLSITGTNIELTNANLQIYNLTSVLASGTFKISLQVFGWLKDIELKAPTGRLPTAVPTVKAVYQVATEAPGPVTEISGMVAQGASALSNIPVIGTAASAVSWVANLTNKVASIFGWSRPIDGSHSQAFANIPARGFGHIKAKDNAVVLGLANDNSLGEVDLNFTRTVDEMQVEYVCNRPGMVYCGLWVDNAIANAKLAEVPVGPQINDAYRVSQIGDTLLLDQTLFEYLANNFGYWRADIHFRISFVKTAFHTGRVEIYYVPGTANDDIDTLDSTNCYRQILDLSEKSEFEITIPFMSPYVMCNTAPFNDQIYQAYRAPGRLFVRALTPLIHPDTVSASIGLIIWKWATNVSFACPIDNGFTPFIPVTRADLQINVTNEATVENMIVYGSENTEQHTVEASQAVCGETITSLRALTRAHRPAGIQVPHLGIIPTDVGIKTGGYISTVSNIFAFWRGGLSYKIQPFGEFTVIGGSLRTELVRMLTETVPNNLMSVMHSTFNILNPFHEVAVPYYGNTRRSMTNDTRMLTDNYNSTSRHPGIRLLSSNPSTTFEYYVGAKDDFTCGFLIGAPIISRDIV